MPNDLEHIVSATSVHESAAAHVAGEARYVDDIPEPTGTVHAYIGTAEITCGHVKSMDLSDVWASPDVVDVITASDIPGANDISPTGQGDEPVLSAGAVHFWGQPLFTVLAKTRNAARVAARRAKISYIERTPAITIEAAQDAGLGYVTDNLTLARGDATAALCAAPRRIAGTFVVGGQDHMYLEGQIALALPEEGLGVTVWSSTQHPSEVQHMVAHVLGCPFADVTVKLRRLGGGFGGKESQMNIFCVLAALGARRNGVAVKLRPDRDQDMIITGKRHDFAMQYEVGFDEQGHIQAVNADLGARCGYSADLSGPVTDRALFHADNAYFYPHVRLTSHPMRTNTVSNTAFRGFGGPQGAALAERMIEEVAYALGEDALTIRKRNLYGTPDEDTSRRLTPYHQEVEDNILPRIIEELEQSSEYQARRAEILRFNKENTVLRKGIALTPVKFGISFTATWYNQAGALLQLYKDGSFQLNHGGTEMGQGLHSKVRFVVAEHFSVPPQSIRVCATDTGKVPNTSATAASSGTDLNAMAALNAAKTIKERLTSFAAETWGVAVDEVTFDQGRVHIGQDAMAFAELVAKAYAARISLSATGFYKTPKIHWDRTTGQGRPFYYFAYGAACSEVVIDSLTGEYRVARADILHDVGQSLSPHLDIGQIEGGFVQGMGWLTQEELFWDKAGRLRTHAPSTYKIPLASDIPPIFNVKLADWSKNFERTIKRSKAVGEPPFLLALSVLEALSMAVASHSDYRHCPRLDAPATPERVLMAIQRMSSHA